MAEVVGVTAYGQSNDPMQSLGLGALFLVVIGSLKKYCKLLLFFFLKFSFSLLRQGLIVLLKLVSSIQV